MKVMDSNKSGCRQIFEIPKYKAQDRESFINLFMDI